MEKKSNESNVAPGRAEKQAIAGLSEWDEDVKFVDLAKEKLIESSNAYEQYRDANAHSPLHLAAVQSVTRSSGGGFPVLSN